MSELAKMVIRALDSGSCYLGYIVDRKIDPEESWFVWAETQKDAIECVETWRKWRGR